MASAHWHKLLHTKIAWNTLRESDDPVLRAQAFSTVVKHVCLDHLLVSVECFEDGEKSQNQFERGLSELMRLHELLTDQGVDRELMLKLQANPEIIREASRRKANGEDVGVVVMDDHLEVRTKQEMIDLASKLDEEPSMGQYL